MSQANPEPVIQLADQAQEQRKAQSLRIRRGIAKTLHQAVDLQELAYNCAMELKESFDDNDKADQARARAMAVASTVKAWETAVDRVRIWRGKALPGSKKPAPEPVHKVAKAPAFTPFQEG